MAAEFGAVGVHAPLTPNDVSVRERESARGREERERARAREERERDREKSESARESEKKERAHAGARGNRHPTPEVVCVRKQEGAQEREGGRLKERERERPDSSCRVY